MSDFDDIQYDRLPEHLRDGMRRYVEKGRRPGDFLMAVLRNDLMAATTRADEVSYKHLREIVGWCWWELPSSLWLSPDNVGKWIKQHAEQEAMVAEALNGEGR